MADRPAQICQLEKGKLIDTQQGFADTFNWVAQSMANLQGGENCEVSWTLPDHPTIDVTATEEQGGGGGVTAAVYDVVEDTQDDKDGITIQYTDDREDSFIPFPSVSSEVSGTFVTDVKGYYNVNRLSVDYSDGTNKTIYLPTALSSLSREKGWLNYNDVISARTTNGGSYTAYLGITLSGTNGYGTNQATEFKLKRAYDSNIVINASGNEITFGVYYI